MRIIIICLFFLQSFSGSNSDFILACQKGYRISGVKRVNSAYQRGKLGSLSIECQPIQERNLNEVKCETWTSAPQCNGAFEGCTGSQWLAGFQAYLVENTTNAILLDPICCSSSSIRVDSFSCASERLNVAQKSFDHAILSNDLIYRGLQCWHQYNTNNTLIDLVWKMEICQFSGEPIIQKKKWTVEACPPCDCHCGIDTCADGKEPIRVVHKHLSPDDCSCDCLCKYECV